MVAVEPCDGGRADRGGRPPGSRGGPAAVVPTDGDASGQARRPGGRRPDPSSFDPGLMSLPGPLAADDPRTTHSPLFVGPPLDLDLQPGSRLRVGPRHGAGE